MYGSAFDIFLIIPEKHSQKKSLTSFSILRFCIAYLSFANLLIASWENHIFILSYIGINS